MPGNCMVRLDVWLEKLAGGSQRDFTWGGGGEVSVSQVEWETEAAPPLQEMRGRVSYLRADGGL